MLLTFPTSWKSSRKEQFSDIVPTVSFSSPAETAEIERKTTEIAIKIKKNFLIILPPNHITVNYFFYINVSMKLIFFKNQIF